MIKLKCNPDECKHFCERVRKYLDGIEGSRQELLVKNIEDFYSDDRIEETADPLLSKEDLMMVLSNIVLSDKQLLYLILVYWHGFKQTEIADIFGIQKQSVNDQLKLAKNKLYKLLKI